jgi:uncharacterized protein YuzB (UPF0349 family)
LCCSAYQSCPAGTDEVNDDLDHDPNVPVQDIVCIENSSAPQCMEDEGDIPDGEIV